MNSCHLRIPSELKTANVQNMKPAWELGARNMRPVWEILGTYQL